MLKKIKLNSLTKALLLVIFAITFTTLGFFARNFIKNTNNELISPFISQQLAPRLPLLEYSIINLRDREYQSSEIVIEKILEKNDNFTSYLFSYQTMNKKMTGQLNIPDNITASPTQKRSVIVMLRGFVPQDIYQTGVGTKHMAEVLANHGYITVAPDFFGFGESDPASKDNWQARFEKPVNVVELINSVIDNDIPLNDEQRVKIDSVGIWAHSNGGQIALTTLEILDRNIPTSLWAPVTAPFPYSILYFTDELEDEGKETRKWLSMFEEKYNVFEFSLTKHLDLLQGPIQIQHGTNDDASLIYWSKEFAQKIEDENTKRKETKRRLDSEEIEFELIEYKDNDHNMSPNWSGVANKDVWFFNKYLKNTSSNKK